MISPASLVAVATAVSLSSALPAPEPQGLPTPAADTVYYYFKTQVQAGQPTKFNNLYLAAYHTGAGLSDATLGETTPLPAHRGWFNGTALNWFQPDNGNNYFGFDYQGSSDMYASWSPVTINGGPGSPGLGLDAENRLVVEVNKDAWSSWVSWLVCDWFHSEPQLFTLYNYHDPVIPCSCAKVDLLAEVAPPLASTTTSSAVAGATANSA